MSIDTDRRRDGRRVVSEQRTIGVVFVGLIAAAAVAMAAAYLILGRLIIDAGAGDAGPLLVIAGGALVGTLTAYIIHEVGDVLPSVMARLYRR